MCPLTADIAQRYVDIANIVNGFHYMHLIDYSQGFNILFFLGLSRLTEKDRMTDNNDTGLLIYE